MFIKLNNGQIEIYPYSINQLKFDNPQVSFPSTLSDELLSEYEVYKVEQTESPTFTYKQMIVEDIPVNIKGIWKQVWQVVDKQLEEINSIQESNRKEAYREESDPLFFKWQRGEIEKQVWLDKVAEIKARWA